MRSTIRIAMTVAMATVGLVGCGDLDALEASGEEDGAGTAAEEVATATSALTFSECSTRIINRGNEPAVKALVGNLVSMHDLGNGGRGEYSKGGSIFCNGANGDTKFVIGLIRQKYFFMVSPRRAPS